MLSIRYESCKNVTPKNTGKFFNDFNGGNKLSTKSSSYIKLNGMRVKMAITILPPLSWGVVAYSGGPDDPTRFDGWYRDREDAEGACKYWRERLRGWEVYLVERHLDERRTRP